MEDKIRIVENLLQSHGLRKTHIRIELLLLFLRHEFALALSDIKARLKGNFDRITLYRALNSFLEAGLLHLVPDVNHGTKYALCSENCPHHAHQDVHVHFICKKCHNTFCLENVKVPYIKLSADFHAEDFDYTISGVCKECNRKLY